MTEELFHMDPIPGDPSKPISELAAIHRDGVPLLRKALGDDRPEGADILRVRSADDLYLDNSRRYQVTIRTKTAGGAKADEWDRLHNGEVSVIAYGFLARNPDRISDFVVLDGPEVLRCLMTRPTCQVRVPNARTFEHHAPGGASFIVIDVRHLTPECVLRSTFRIDHDPAPVTVQQGMF